VSVAIAHDYLTQRGGAERVVVSMLRAFPDAPVHTTLYEPSLTFSEFADADVHPSVLNRVGLLRRNHRLAFPLLAPTVGGMQVDADVVLCSTSGWAHGVQSDGAKVVYCHSPARWLYQTDRYVARMPLGARPAIAALGSPLRRWDRRSARTASRYLVNSTHVARSVQDVYGLDAEVLPPPPALTPDGEVEPVAGLEPGFFLCVSRLLPYKNVDSVVAAFRSLRQRLVVVGDGPDRERLSQLAGPNVRLLGSVDDARLRWLYANATALVAASYEDFGLTPLEAASFGKPVAVLRYGGFMDTVAEGATGVFFDRPDPTEIAAAVAVTAGTPWDTAALRAHAERFAEARFVSRLQEVVREAAA
jgi:glycosyltransferase involved in cell wall biosynthesis